MHQLTDKVAKAFGTEHDHPMKATIVSFGFKYGIPVDADLRGRHALPAQPALGPRAASPDRP